MDTSEKYSLEEIRKLIIIKTGCNETEVQPDTDLVSDLGCYGDDLDELMGEYAQRFGVDMEGYLWYFHSEEESHANNIGRVFFKAPYERVKHISITPKLLLQSANAGKWLVRYPEHILPKWRFDILINQILVLAFVIFLIYKCSK